MNKESKSIINCVKCEYFHVTWDKKFPNGCSLYGFKSATFPARTVHEATGSACSNFKNKDKK